MSASSDLLNTIQSSSAIVLAQIPAACARVAVDTRYALSSLKNGSDLSSLSVSMEASVIYCGVLTYYTNIMSNANNHENSLAGNEYASQSAREWRRSSGLLLEALVDGLSSLPEAEKNYIDACKQLNLHIMNNANCYDGSSRVKRTNQLTEIIQRKEPDYRKPAAIYPGFGLAVFSSIAALLLFAISFLLPWRTRIRMGLGSMPFVAIIEAIALFTCVILMKKEKALPAKIFSAIPLLCHLIHLFRNLYYLPRAICSVLWYVPYSGFGTGHDLCIAVAGISMFALMIILPLYIWGIMKVDFKNVWASLCFTLMLISAAAAAIITACTSSYGNGFYLPCLVSVLMVTTATCIIWRFQNFPLKKPAPQKKAML